MGDETRIRSLLEEVLNSGRTPEDVCAADRELLEEVKSRWFRIQDLAGNLERAFPSSAMTRPFERWPAMDPQALPDIPGYQLDAVIGHGGMGVVYRARHTKLDRVVAVKMLRHGDDASPRELEGLLKEARAIAALTHPHIVQVHDVGGLGAGDGGGGTSLPYFTMEYVEGGSLARRLDGKPMPAREAATLVASLADAVHAAHIGGVVHRDLKPANILLGADGCPKITDFGLARRTRGDPGSTLSGAAAGTPSYMAPEQALGTAEAFGPSVDLYALGAVLYELLTGRPPFRAESNAETQRQVVSEEPVPPSRLNPKVPRDLEVICLKCLEKAVSRRYGTAQDVSDDLGRFLRGEPVRARPAGPLERVGKWARRHPAHAAAGLGALAAVGAILGAVLWVVSQRAAVERAVSDDLAEVVRLERASDWRGARNTLERAKTRLRAAANGHRLGERASEIERELDLVDRLGAMRFEWAASREVEFDKAEWWARYRAAFTEAGLLADGDTSEAFAARVARSPAKSALVRAMDDWTICGTNPADHDWLLSATRLADPDPWRDRVRDRKTWSDPVALAALAREAPVETQPATLLLIVAGRLLGPGTADEAEALIRRVQAAHPADFWSNFALGECLDDRKDPDAIGYYRAAIALRPDAAAAHVALGNSLHVHGRQAEAIESMRRAVALDPGSYAAQHNLGYWLLGEGKLEEAIAHAREAVRVAPTTARAHRLLGRALGISGKFCEAAESFRRSLELAPGNAEVQAFLEKAEQGCERERGSQSPAGGSPP